MIARQINMGNGAKPHDANRIKKGGCNKETNYRNNGAGQRCTKA